MTERGVCGILAILMAFVLVVGCAAMPAGGDADATNYDNTSSTGHSEKQGLGFSYYYQPINISVNASVPSYPLPLNLSTVSNIEDITKLWLNKTEEELLGTNGFVILDYGQKDDIVAPYKHMKDRGIPIFVTTDTLLHLYHIQFNEMLKGIEEREFFDALVDMSNAMLNQSVRDYENFTDPELKESARRNVAYFAVALNFCKRQLKATTVVRTSK